MTSFDTGRQAEAAAATYLQQRGFRILAQNWRNRRCEIDIVASKAGVVYFAEVKYRKTDRQGDGLAYVTPQKLSQMQFAAEQWAYQNRYDGDYRLAAISVAGADFRVEELIIDITV